MSGHGIPLDQAELLGTMLEAILYGFSLLMFGGTVWVLFSWRSTQQVNRVMLTVACLLLLCSSVHLIISIIRIMDAFILYRDTFPGGPIAFLSDVSQWTFKSKNYVYAIQLLIGDGVILYRCHVVWKSKCVLILPALAWCGSAVAGIGIAVEAALSVSSLESFVQWTTPFYAAAFTTNLMTTVLLAWRIWHIDKKAAKLRGHQKSPLRQTLHVIIYAGAIYNFTLIAAWICFSLQLNAQFVVLDIIVHVISITFYMVIIRVGLFHREDQQARTPFGLRSTGNSVQIHITALSEDNNGEFSSLRSPASAIGPSGNDAKFNDPEVMRTM